MNNIIIVIITLDFADGCGLRMIMIKMNEN